MEKIDKDLRNNEKKLKLAVDINIVYWLAFFVTTKRN